MTLSPSPIRHFSVLATLFLLLTGCATPPPPVIVVPVPKPVVVLPPPEIDDDHKSVSKAQFLEGNWAALPGVESWVQERNAVALTLSDKRVVRVTFLTNRNFRLWFPPAGSNPEPSGRNWPEAPVDLKVSENDAQLLFLTPGLQLLLDKKSLAWEVRSGAMTLLKTPSGPKFLKKRLKQEFSMAAEPLWTGLGSAGKGINKLGQWVKLWADADNADGTGPWVVPFVLAAGGAQPFGLFVDNSYQSYFNLDPQSPFVGTLNGGLDLAFWAGNSVADVVDKYTALLGRTPRSPSASLTTGLVMPPGETGAFARKANLSLGRAEVSDLDKGQLEALQKTHFWPVDASAALAPLWAPTDWNQTWDVDGKSLLRAQVNNLFANWAVKNAAETQAAKLPGFRPWITWGTGFAGASKWGVPEWTASGDNTETLGQILTAGLSGLGTPQVRLDVQGLSDPAKAAATWRGLQALLLNPYLVLDFGRAPAEWYASLDDKTKKLLKTTLDRRSALKPVMLDVVRQAATTGAPALRPLFWSFPSDPRVRDIADEYLLGDSLLVAPAVDAGSRKVYLPGGGIWFQWPSGDEFGGGQTYELSTEVAFPLVFTKGGSFIPVREPETYDDKATYNPLTIHVYPGGMGSWSYSVDDGVTKDAERGLITTTRFDFSYKANSMELASEVVENGPKMRYVDPYVLFRLHKVYKPKTIKIDGKAIPLYGDSFGITDTDRSAAWYENDSTLLIKAFAPERGQVISMTF